MKYIDTVNVQGKCVFLRADLNVPYEEKNGKNIVADQTRVVATLPTIQFLRENGARIVVASHLGRPKGAPEAKYSLAPVAELLKSLLKCPVTMAEDCVGEPVSALKAKLSPGEVLLLENLRFHPEEEKNDEHFAKQLAEGCDVYVNDAFASCHRAHASVAAITKFIPISCGGFTVKTELQSFEKALLKPERPLLVAFGGAKVSTKIDAVENVASKVDAIVIGGAMANTFLAATGLQVGKSVYEPDLVERSKEILATLKARGVRTILPVDVVVSPTFAPGAKTTVVSVQNIPADQMAVDVGPETVQLFKEEIKKAKTVIWNGPLGAFEIPEFAAGTYGFIDALTSSSAYTIVGGGDTDRALHERHAFDKMGYVSTAGGAFLTLLEGKSLPGVEALKGN